MLDETLGETLRERAKALLYEAERKKAQTAKAIGQYEHRFYDKGDFLNETEMDDWKSKELYAIDLANERDTVFNTIVRLGIMSQEEAANYIAAIGKELGLDEIRTRR